MVHKIFVNYRWDDAGPHARSIRDRLIRKFRKNNVFMDVESVQPGERVDQKLYKALDACDVFLAVIGPRWYDLLWERASVGKPDYVRKEIVAALHRQIRVIPVLVGGAEWPPVGKLPDDLRAFRALRGLDVKHERFPRDIEDLVRKIRSSPKRSRRPAWWAVSLAAVCVLLIAAIGTTTVFDRRSKAPDLGHLVPGESFRDCSDCPEMVPLQAGNYLMGSPETEIGRGNDEEPQREVHIPALAVGKFEITVKEYKAFIRSWGPVADGGGCHVWTAYGHRFESDRSFRNPSFSQTNSDPVVCVSWQAATTYTNWLAVHTGKKYRLLSEAEWEYAARANSTAPYYFGDDEAVLCLYGNGADRTSAFLWGNHLCSDGVGVQTAEVGRYRPNSFGLFDMLGNVWEWVQDCKHEDYAGAPTDGSPWMTGPCQTRVIRGGAWDSATQALRSADRGAMDLKGKDNIGFRVARELE